MTKPIDPAKRIAPVWTPTQERVLETQYAEGDIAKIIEQTGKTRKQIEMKAHRMGLKKIKPSRVGMSVSAICRRATKARRANASSLQDIVLSWGNHV